MITMQGKYNSANIMIDEIDETTKTQIQQMLNHPIFKGSYIAIMPDCHAGSGSVIGFTMPMNDYIIPNIVGVDIGCGMYSVKLKEKINNLEFIDNFIKNNIAHGFQINPSYNVEKRQETEIVNTCNRIGIDKEKALKAICSLGGGNHFIEIGIDDDGNNWITVHSGSRNFGLKVANFYQKKAKDELKKYFIEDQYNGLEFLLVDSDYGMDYLHDLSVAQRFASTNRKQIVSKILYAINIESIDMEIESVHNYIGDDNIIRKGATPAYENQLVIIPFNMRDGLIVAKGKGNKKYNFSAPHGAGRILSRKKAKQTLSIKDFKSQMDGIYTTTATEKTLDESPMAYKDMNIILQNISETVDIVNTIRPIYNFKAQ